jgi:hypothetical protein
LRPPQYFFAADFTVAQFDGGQFDLARYRGSRLETLKKDYVA